MTRPIRGRAVVLALLLPLLLTSCTLNSYVFYTRSPLKEISHIKTEDVQLTADDGTTLRCLFLTPEGDALATIFLLQGNGGNVSTMAPLAQRFVKHGFQVFLMAYRGYGGSGGEPDFESILRDAELALYRVKARPDAKDKKLIVLGYSLGGYFAYKLVERHPDVVDALVTEGAFTTLNRLGWRKAPLLLKPIVKLIVASPYNSKSLAAGIHIPKLIIHSTEDTVIPFDMGKAIYAAAAEPKMFWPIDGSHCSGIMKYENEYCEKVQQLIAFTPLSLPIQGEHP